MGSCHDHKTTTLRPLALLLLGVILVISVLYGGSRITAKPPQKDGYTNLLIAYNLAHSGIFALGTNNLEPTMYREPLPILAWAGWMTALGQARINNFGALNGNPGIVQLKYLNLLWTAGSLVLIFLIVLALTGSDAIALLAALIAIPAITKGIDEFYTEIPATSLILASCYATLLLVKKPTLACGLIAGMCLGAAILTKAIILYVLPFVAVGSVVLLFKQTRSARQAFAISAAFVVGSAVIVTPWIVRNAVVIGEAQLADRGGPVLYKRMLLDNMTWEEYRGSFYVWAPHKVRRVLEPAFGFTRADMAPGGPLQRLNRKVTFPADQLALKQRRPDLATTFRHRMLAERARLTGEFRKQGYTNATTRGDREMMREAFPWILSHPLQHAALMIPLAWRGMWVIPLPAWLAPIALLSLLAAPLVGWAARRWDFIAFSLLPLGIFGLYAATTHFIPRYSEPLVETMLICLAVIAWWFLSSRQLKGLRDVISTRSEQYFRRWRMPNREEA